jgi:hypothetical protein
MILALIIIFLVNVIILTLGVKLGCMVIRHDLEWSRAFMIGGITSAVSIIPSVGPYIGIIALLICLVTLGDMDFWPESIMVTIILKALSIAITLAIIAAMR